jgi:hypothetical protein
MGTDSVKELIVEIEKRFEVVLTISIFFPVLMTAYFDIVGGLNKTNNTAFSFFALPGYYILSYVFFQFLKKQQTSKLALYVFDWSLLLGIACFAIPTLFAVISNIGVKMAPTTLWLGTWEFIVSMFGMSCIAFFIFYFAATCIIFCAIPKKWANKKVF